MKAFVKQWVLLFGFVVISAFVIPAIFNGYWENAWIIIKLLITTLTICILTYLLEKLPIELPILKHFVNMCAVLVIVFIYGWIWQWYMPSTFWIVFAMVIPVYVVMVLLDVIKIKQDVEIINKQIQYRKQKRLEEKQSDC